MTQKVVLIPTVNDTSADFTELFQIWSNVNGYYEDVRFVFTHCNFLRPNAVAFLGGLTSLIQLQAGTVIFDWGTVRPAVMVNLCQNGFAGTFGYPSSNWDGNSIPYREDQSRNVQGIMDYLEQYWLGRGWVHVSSRLRDAIVGHVWEIYNNAFEHSGSVAGVLSCGQHFPSSETLVLSVIDFGEGIPGKVRAFLQQHVGTESASQLTDSSCLKWAFKAGTSTKVNEPGGAGLDLLKQFININQGKLEIYSNNAYAIIDSTGEKFINTATNFLGTVVHVTLRCDEKLYLFRNEI